jgi:rRNA-processing protein FCF1
MVGQSAVESNKQQIIHVKCGDDEILNCCLQTLEATKKLILLTNDKNLRNKAFVNKIEAFSRDMLYLIDFNMKNDIKFN